MFSRSLTTISDWLEGLGRVTLLGKEAIASILRWKVGWREFIYQLYFIGVKSQSVVLITGAFTGMVLWRASRRGFSFARGRLRRFP